MLVKRIVASIRRKFIMLSESNKMPMATCLVCCLPPSEVVTLTFKSELNGTCHAQLPS